MYLAVQLQKKVHQEFCNPRCCSWFPSYFLIRFLGHKVFLHLAHVDLVDQFARCTLWYRSSFVFMHTTVSMQTAGSVS